VERGGQSWGERWERLDVIPFVVRDVTKRGWVPGAAFDYPDAGSLTEQ
jgi:hypothetical protein